MSPTLKGPGTVGSAGFDPDKFFEEQADPAIENNELRSWVINAFKLKTHDDYIYRAIAEVTLPQVQRAINHGAAGGLHAWYVNEDAKQIAPPPEADIDAYTNIFSSTTSTGKALTAFEKNAKKGSIRARVASNLVAKRLFPISISIPKLKKKHANPYLDVWAWSCRNLEWVGPDEATANVKQSHHILPVFYHHFGCVCPSYESIEAMKCIAKGRQILDLGSGNGYWTYILRRAGMTVHAVDNGDSIWRTMWIADTIKADGAKHLVKEGGARNAVLLLVYPQVTTEFTASVLHAYAGSTICIAGTQNANGFTAFKDTSVDEYIKKEKPRFQKILQTPLPSFAGKDEAFFVFEAQS